MDRFITPPSFEILENALEILGYKTPFDPIEFSKKSFTPYVLTQLEIIFVELAPLYIRDNYIELPLTPRKAIKIINHLCNAFQFKIKARERGHNKTTFYRICPIDTDSIDLDKIGEVNFN